MLEERDVSSASAGHRPHTSPCQLLPSSLFVLRAFSFVRCWDVKKVFCTATKTSQTFFFYHPSSECRKKNLTIQDPQKKVEKKILCLPNQVWPASLNQETINRCYFLFYFFLWVLCVSICQTHLRPRRVFFFILVKRRFIHSADFRRHEQIFLFTIQ